MTAKTGSAIGLAALGIGIGVWGIVVASRPAPNLTVNLPAPPPPNVAPASAPATPALEPEPARPVLAPEKAKPIHAAKKKAPPVAQAQSSSPAPAAAPTAQTPPAPAAPTVTEVSVRPAAPPPPPILKPEPAKPAPPKAATVTIPAGTLITVRLSEALSSERNTDGDAFHATLDQPLVIDGMAIAERGSLQRGKVVSAVRSGKVKGRASLSIALAELSTSDGQRIPIQTDTFLREADSTVRRDVTRTGVAAGIGAAIGAMIGGGKGAAIGAGVGGAAGAGTAMATRGAPAELASETRLTFRLSAPVTITERIN